MAPSKCFGAGSLVFVQAACTIPEAQIIDRQVFGLMICCLGLSVAFFVSVYTDYMSELGKFNFLDSDIKTVTVGDYSIEFDVTEDFWMNFKQR